MVLATEIRPLSGALTFQQSRFRALFRSFTIPCWFFLRCECAPLALRGRISVASIVQGTLYPGGGLTALFHLVCACCTRTVSVVACFPEHHVTTVHDGMPVCAGASGEGTSQVPVL